MGLMPYRYARRVDANVLDMVHDDGEILVRFEKGSGYRDYFGGGGAGADLTFYPNIVNTRPRFIVKASTGDCGFYSGASGDHKFYNNNTHIGTVTLGGGSAGGILQLKETTTPTALADFGALYTKADNHLYFQDGAGAEHDMGSP